MRHLFIGFLFVSLAHTLLSADDYHTFNDSQGREIQAKILRTHGDKIVIQRADGTEFTVAPSIFTKEDQLYIQKWIKDSILSGGNVVEIKSRSKTTRKTDEDDGAIETKHYKGYYEIEVKNNSDLKLTNLVAEYRYYVFHNDIAAERRSDGDKETVKGELKISALPAYEKTTLETKQTKMKDTKLKPGWHYLGGGKEKSEDELEGIWIKVMKDKQVIAEFAYPSNLPEKEKW